MTNPAAAAPATPVAHEENAHANQFALLGQRRFAPFFWTQFAGAANDNLFKFAFTVMVTFQLQLSWMPPSMAAWHCYAIPAADRRPSRCSACALAWG